MDKARRRKIIRNAAILFLAVMAVLTFFSGTIRNMSLQEVETAAVRNGTITTEIRDTVSIETVSTYQVVLPRSGEIETVQAALGDEVHSGDVLFTLVDDGDSEEIEAAREELDQLRLNYEVALLDEPLPPYVSDNTEIQSLQEALNRAVAERNALGKTSLTLTEAQTKLTEAQNKKTQADDAVSQLQSQLSQVEANDITYPGIRQEAMDYQDKVNVLSEMQNQYDGLVAAQGGKGYLELVNEIELLEQQIDAMAPDDPTIGQASARLRELQEQRDALAPAYTSLTDAKEGRDSAFAALETKKQTERQALLKKIDQAKSAAETADQAYKKAEAEYENVKRIKDAEAAVTAAQSALSSRIAALEVRQQADQTAQDKTRLQLNDMEREIEEKEAALAELEQTEMGKEVRAPPMGSSQASMCSRASWRSRIRCWRKSLLWTWDLKLWSLFRRRWPTAFLSA